MADLLESLNERQREAVLETEGYVRVIAGAGSGKTKLLVSRYAYLVQEYGIDCANILCVTFTNKAAGEMKRRIRTLIGDGNDVSLICTYHGFCNRLLRENPEKLFLSKQFQIIDEPQQKAVLGEIYQKRELKLDHATFESILRKIGYAKKDMGYVTKMCDPQPCQILDVIRNLDDQIIEEFLQRQKATYSLDFHDLIAYAIYLLETDDEVRQKWQERLNYIMVDEFQDSTKVEMRLVELLSGMYRNLMIVGDPDQNIYEWRGADVKLLVDFDKEHEPTRTIILNQNYRSTPQILQCANTLIEKNELRLKKDLFTQNASGAPVIHYHSRDEFKEMDHVIDNIRRLQEEEGFRYSDFAILYRASFLSRVAEKKLVEKNIPYEIYGGVRFYQRMEILDILAYLKLIAYDDDVSFKRIVNKPRRRFGRAKMNFLENLRDQERENMSLFSTLAGHLEEQELQNSDVGDFVRLIQTAREGYREKRISEIVNEITRDSGYESYIRELGDEERLDNLAEFKRIANEFEREFGEDLSLEGFLQQIALQSGENSEESKDAVKLMTIHSSKGLEFPVVFILGFTEGVFPSAKTLGDRKNLGLEEERRLCYVAITRAKKYLFLMESEGSSQAGSKKLISRFLEEIGEKNYVRIGRISEELMRESRGYAAKLNCEMQAEPIGSRKVGDIVEHHIFGKGTIEAIDEKRRSYSIRFENTQYPRIISSSYFAKEHVDLRPKDFETRKTSEAEKGSGEERTSEAEKGSGAEKTSEAEKVSESVKEYITAAGEGETSGAERECETGNKRDDSCNFSTFANEREELPELDMVEDDEDFDTAESETGFESEEISVQEETDALPVAQAELSEQEKARAALLQELKANSPNLWKREDVPHCGWSCVGVEDLGEPAGICEMCGYQIIRYVHQMEHPNYRSLAVGCVCAGRMEGDVAQAKRREAEFKNKQTRRVNFFKRTWKQSRKGNEYLKIDGHVVVLYHHVPDRADMKGRDVWKYSIDNTFCQAVYTTRERALAGAFDALEELKA